MSHPSCDCIIISSVGKLCTCPPQLRLVETRTALIGWDPQIRNKREVLFLSASASWVSRSKKLHYTKPWTRGVRTGRHQTENERGLILNLTWNKSVWSSVINKKMFEPKAKAQSFGEFAQFGTIPIHIFMRPWKEPNLSLDWVYCIKLSFVTGWGRKLQLFKVIRFHSLYYRGTKTIRAPLNKS